MSITSCIPGASSSNRSAGNLRAASEEEVERRKRKRYPVAGAILVHPEESWRQNSASIAPNGQGR